MWNMPEELVVVLCMELRLMCPWHRPWAPGPETAAILPEMLSWDLSINIHMQTDPACVRPLASGSQAGVFEQHKPRGRLVDGCCVKVLSQTHCPVSWKENRLWSPEDTEHLLHCLSESLTAITQGDLEPHDKCLRDSMQ
ncbi:unnamed protein product [Boreogadus saida]